MDTKIIVTCAEWEDEPNPDGYHVMANQAFNPKHVASLDELPDWLRERCMLLRILDNDVDSPMGAWTKNAHKVKGENPEVVTVINYWIVPQPEDPVQLKEKDR